MRTAVRISLKVIFWYFQMYGMLAALTFFMGSGPFHWPRPYPPLIVLKVVGALAVISALHVGALTAIDRLTRKSRGD